MNTFRWQRHLAALIFSVFFLASPQGFADYHTLGILGGVSFPKALFGKVDLNIAENWGLDYQASIGVFWTIQQADILYYFDRSEWSPYLGLGAQNWNFYGFSSSTNYNGIIFGSGNQATAVTVPLGLIYVAANGFAVDLTIAADVFVGAPLDLKGRVVPEADLALGYFF